MKKNILLLFFIIAFSAMKGICYHDALRKDSVILTKCFVSRAQKFAISQPLYIIRIGKNQYRLNNAQLTKSVNAKFLPINVIESIEILKNKNHYLFDCDTKNQIILVTLKNKKASNYVKIFNKFLIKNPNEPMN